MDEHTIGDVRWIHVDEPSTQDLAFIREELGLPRFALDLASRHHHRPRLETYDNCLLLVLKPATYVDPAEVIEIGQLVVIAGRDKLVTVGPGRSEWLDEIRRALDADASGEVVGSARVVHAIADRVVDGYSEVLDALDNDVDEIEAQVFSTRRGSHAERIYRLKSEVHEFRRAAVPLPDELDDLPSAVDAGFVELADQFADVRVRAVRVAEHVGHLDELLNSALNAHLAQIAIQQNNDMRRISAWVAIVAAPTAMASIYGMNFRFMPELGWRYGYPSVLLLMATVACLLYLAFRRSDWL